jgi:hypothetical protein
VSATFLASTTVADVAELLLQVVIKLKTLRLIYCEDVCYVDNIVIQLMSPFLFRSCCVGGS